MDLGRPRPRIGTHYRDPLSAPVSGLILRVPIRDPLSAPVSGMSMHGSVWLGALAQHYLWHSNGHMSSNSQLPP